MSKRINESFLNSYIELDKVCCEKFGVTAGGISEYINRLNNARFAPDRDEVLPKLVRYSNVHKRFSYEPGAVRKSDDVVRDDIKWVKHFKTSLLKKKDPISKYLRKARRYAMRKKAVRWMWAIIAFLIIAAIIALILIFA